MVKARISGSPAKASFAQLYITAVTSYDKNSVSREGRKNAGAILTCVPATYMKRTPAVSNVASIICLTCDLP